MANVELFQVPVELRLEFGAVVGLDDENAEWQSTKDLVDELNRRYLRAGVVNLEYANARAVVDCGELIEPLPYLAACPELRALGAHFGDVAIVHNTKTGKTCAGVLADGCPHSHHGESSIAMAEAVGVPSSPRNGGCEDGVVFVVFCGSSKGWPRSNADVAAQAGELLSARPDLQALLVS